MASVAFEARLIVNTLALFGNDRKAQEEWLIKYLQGRDARATQQRRVFAKTDPTTLESGSSSSGSPAS